MGNRKIGLILKVFCSGKGFRVIAINFCQPIRFLVYKTETNIFGAVKLLMLLLPAPWFTYSV